VYAPSLADQQRGAYACVCSLRTIYYHQNHRTKSNAGTK
jgi:hypothetical protein